MSSQPKPPLFATRAPGHEAAPRAWMGRVLSPLYASLLTAAVWTVLLVVSLCLNIEHERDSVFLDAQNAAITNLNKDISFRKWATGHGGVYVPVTETQKPVPFLEHVPGRDVTTTDGRQLTLLNPASIIRQVMDSYSAEYGIKGRIVGIKQLNPANAPDAWEKAQLEAFQRGEGKEATAISEIEGAPHLRHLRALYMTPGCEKCHAVLGYKEGDLRGAIGVNIPLAPYQARSDATVRQLVASYGVVWLFGLLGIAWFGRQMSVFERSRAQREEALRRSEERIRNMSDAAGAYLWEIDADMVYTYISGQSLFVKGHPPEALLGHTPMEFMPEEDIAPVGEIVKRAIADKSSFVLQHRDITPSGEVWWEEVHGAVYLDADGKVVGLRGTGMSINARKQAEAKLLEIINLNEKIFSSSLVGIETFLVETGQCIFANQRAASIVNATVEQLLAQDFRKIGSWQRFGLLEAAEDVIATQADRRFELNIVTTFGKNVWLDVMLSTFTANGKLHLLLMFEDITERKLVSDELRRSEERFRNMSDAAGAYLWEVDADLVYTYISGQSLFVKGHPPEALLGHTPMEFMPEEDIVPVGEIVKRAIADKSNFVLQHRDITPSGEVWWEEVHGAVYLDTDGKVIGLRGTGMSINARKAAEARIKRLTNLYAGLSECNQAIVRCTNRNDLFESICRNVVNYGGMKMAWIALLDEERREIRAAASHGEGLAYLDGLHISLDTDDPYGRGPTGTAIREGQPVWNQDFMNSPQLAPWYDRAAKFGFHASASLPLRCQGRIIGAFNLYAGQVNAFDDDARVLLEEMASDISYALDSLERDASLKLAAEVFEQGREGIMITDTTGRIVRVNRAFTQISGYSEAEALGQSAKLLSSGRQSKEFYAEMWAAINATGHWQGEIWNRRKDGGIYPEWLAISRVLGPDGQPSHYVGIFNDITQHKQAEERIQRLAHFDALTGLPNRALLNDRCRHAISMAQRAHEQLAVLFLDLDHFKNINDTLGHRIGDELLIEISQRMKSLVREEDTVSRQGGDEFIILLPGTDAGGAVHVAEKLIRGVSGVFKVDQYELIVTPSIGISMYPGDGEDFETLYKCADTAMYRAKQEGRNAFRFFTPEMQEHSARKLQLEGALRHALDRDQLQLHYQPQVSLKDGSVIGAEALLRWRHPELGTVSPAEFIPVAEDSGLILPIGEWVLRTAVRQMKAWMDSGIAPQVIAVNLSAVQFRHAHLPGLVSGILAEEGLAPQHLELELTEGVAMDDPLAAIAVMDDLHARGIRMSIDDFGTGYSSLSYLKRFQVYKLKIDQSFVRDITVDPEDRAIVGAVISLADSLGLCTIAEGVETEEQLAFLRDQGCQEVQGYFYSRPLPAEEFAAFVRGQG